MYQYVVPPVAISAGPVLQNIALDNLVDDKTELFERLPVNLSFDEIRAMVRDILG